jgi:phenylalanyl-tRNA synthetase beta chain
MKISYNWLKQYVSTDKTPDQISEILTDIGLEVEKLERVESVKGGLQGVVVGEVLTCVKHEDADKLKVTTIDVNGGEELSIVCGAPNVAAGQKVIVATVGTTLYPSPEEPFKIKKSKIRGVESAGMLCAEDELGLGQSHDGILVLPEDTKVGMSAAEYFGLEDDYVFEIGLTPNRADAMGHIGVARDLAAYLSYHEAECKIQWPDNAGFKAGSGLDVKIEIENAEACPKYAGLTISNVKVEASPAWLQKRLRSIGMSPINNIVDVTNFVMMEYGTPLHAFDLAKVGGKVVVRNSKGGAKFKTLDEIERTLDAEDLVITNGSDNMCLAGLFGGIDFGIKDETTNVFLESAYFEAVSTRKMARRHGLNTDASFRFERGVDPKLTMEALKRAAQLICEVSGGTIASEAIEVVAKKVEDSCEVKVNWRRCRMLMGTELSNDEMKRLLTYLDIKELNGHGDESTLSIPAYRVDVTREADVIEEILRIYGFNKIELPAKLNSSLPNFGKNTQEQWKEKLSEMLVGLGFSEIMNNSLTSSSNVDEMGNDALSVERNVPILNPLSIELDTMRQSLIYGGLDVLTYNQNRQNPSLRMFEFGKTFHKYEDYSENQRLLMMVSGSKSADNWLTKSDAHSFYSLKSYAEALIQKMGLKGMMTYKPIKKSLFEDGLQIYVLKQKIGEIGWPGAKMRKHFGVKGKVFMADLNWDALMDCQKFNKVKFQPLATSFATRRDFSLLISSETTFAQIEEIAKQSDRKILKEVGLFDVYEGDKIEAGTKSYAVSFIFQDDQKTLQDKQVDAVMEKIRKGLEGIGASLRA